MRALLVFAESIPAVGIAFLPPVGIVPVVLCKRLAAVRRAGSGLNGPAGKRPTCADVVRLTVAQGMQRLGAGCRRDTETGSAS
jgi:hypothetical protein